MQSQALTALLKASRFTQIVLWLTLTMSIAIYVVVAWMIASQRGEPRPLESSFELAVTIAAVLAAGLSLFIPRLLLSDDRIRAFLARDRSPQEVLATLKTTPGLAMAERIASLSDEERKLAGIPALFFTPFIVRMVLNESVAVMGLVLALVAQRLDPLLPFAIAAIVLNILSFPRLDPLLERARHLGARSGSF